MATRKKSAAKKSSARSRSRTTAPRGKDAKQQTALHQRTLATRNQAERGDAAADAGDEVTSALPPGSEDPGHVASPSFEEQPVTGDTAGARASRRGKAVKHQAAKAAGSIEELFEQTSGVTLERHANEVRLGVPIAGGTVRYFGGATVKDALEEYQEFVTGGPRLLDTTAGERAGASVEEDQTALRQPAEGRGRLAPRGTVSGRKRSSGTTSRAARKAGARGTSSR